MVIYVTNGTIVPTAEALDVWSVFKEVFICFSTDGIEERFEYLRWPITWNKFKKTVIATAKLKQKQPKIKIMFNTTLNPLNLLYWGEIENWIKETIPKDTLAWPDSLIRPTLNIGVMDFTFVPLEMREEFYKKYGHDHKVSKLLKISKFNPDHSNMFKYLEKIETLRNQSWHTIFSDVAHYFKRPL
jgi:hypothetical protein